MKYLVVLPLCFAAVAAYAQTEQPNGTPEAAPVVFPDQLRSEVLRITTEAGTRSKRRFISFDDPQVILRQITFAPTASPKSGVCEVIIRINDLIAAVGKWEPPGGIVEIWEPPGGIVMTPNDAVVLQVKSVNAGRDDRGKCQVDVVVLATSTTPPLTDGF